MHTHTIAHINAYLRKYIPPIPYVFSICSRSYGLACRAQVTPASSPTSPCSGEALATVARRSRCLRATLEAAPVLCAHAVVTEIKIGRIISARAYRMRRSTHCSAPCRAASKHAPGVSIHVQRCSVGASAKHTMLFPGGCLCMQWCVFVLRTSTHTNVAHTAVNKKQQRIRTQNNASSADCTHHYSRPTHFHSRAHHTALKSQSFSHKHAACRKTAEDT